MEDLHPLLQERDEGKEKRTVQTIFVEIVGRNVGGRYDRDAPSKQLLKKATQDHRIGDVEDNELVEAEDLDLRCEGMRDMRDRVAIDGTIALRFLAKGGDAIVHFAHELME